MFRRRTLSGARVLLTGASSGIGAALTEQLVACGARVLVTARRKERLRQVVDSVSAGRDRTEGPAVVIPCVGDVTMPEHRKRLIARVEDELGGLDILINNAGIGAVGPFATSSPERLRSIMETNLFAPAELIRLAIPLLSRGTGPLIVNIGSVLAHCAVPNKSEYCCSKFALRGLSESLRCELRREGIALLTVEPNTTRSEFFERLIARDGPVAQNRWQQTPEQVARQTLRSIERGRERIVLTCSGKALVWASRLMPGAVSRLLTRFG